MDGHERFSGHGVAILETGDSRLWTFAGNVNSDSRINQALFAHSWKGHIPPYRFRLDIRYVKLLRPQ